MRRFHNESVAIRLDDLRRAQERAREAIAASYPVGSDVIVHHHRGSYSAKVSHICGEFCPSDIGYLSVLNIETGKYSKRYYLDLERQEAQQPNGDE